MGARVPRRGLTAFSLLCGGFLGACALSTPTTVEIGRQLERLSPAWVRAHHRTFQGILERSLAVDAYRCTPLPEEVFSARVPLGTRNIRGTMPHYGLYDGPMRYEIRRTGGAWQVRLRLEVVPRSFDGRLELPDCELAARLEGPVTCIGRPFLESRSLDVCPRTGIFTAPATAHNVRVLLGDWSTRVEDYYNRDARSSGLAVHYDFEFEVTAHEQGPAGPRVMLAPTCARTPYFRAFRSAWTRPIVAHEMGHFLGLLDEYEAFSGIVGFYPKTPFPGADRSRMGLSMKEDSIVLPLHHYLVLRRYFCPEPTERNPYGHVP